MPRDKTQAHEKIVKAAMHEFLTKGFEQASMKSIADAVGMTSAGLYRHFKDKQDMFAELVKPGIALVDEWSTKHKQFSYQAINQESFEAMWNSTNGINDGSLILDVMYQMPEVFRLIICCSGGTSYENYIHDMVEASTDEMMAFLTVCREKGIKTYDVKRVSTSYKVRMRTTNSSSTSSWVLCYTPSSPPSIPRTMWRKLSSNWN